MQPHPHLGWAVGMAIHFLGQPAALGPLGNPVSFILSQALRPAQVETKSKSKQVPLESWKIPWQFLLVQRSRASPVWKRGGGVEEGGSRGESTIVPLGQLASPEKLEWGWGTQVALPLPSNTFQVRLPRSAGGRAGGRGMSAPGWPGAAGLSQGWLLVLVPCVTEERGPKPLSPTSALCFLERGIVLVQELPNGPRQLGDFLIGVQVAVDGLPTEMLQSGHVGGEGPAQHQGNLLAP